MGIKRGWMSRCKYQTCDSLRLCIGIGPMGTQEKQPYTLGTPTVSILITPSCLYGMPF